MGTPGRLWGWDSGPGRLCSWALQGDSGVGYSKETLGLGIRGKSGVGHSRKLWGWVLQGDFGFGHSGTLSRPGEEKSSERGEARRRVEFKI